MHARFGGTAVLQETACLPAKACYKAHGFGETQRQGCCEARTVKREAPPRFGARSASGSHRHRLPGGWQQSGGGRGWPSRGPGLSCVTLATPHPSDLLVTWGGPRKKSPAAAPGWGLSAELLSPHQQAVGSGGKPEPPNLLNLQGVQALAHAAHAASLGSAATGDISSLQGWPYMGANYRPPLLPPGLSQVPASRKPLRVGGPVPALHPPCLPSGSCHQTVPTPLLQ